ncbi:CLIP-associating protein 1 [Galendromus occidentalis]|uniref:CLIP-associating protein 1 n=1 Tax=Galendromus occidentalis TaxID=34638 RepID=A0AAJ7L5B8_9ACAR|nr:CLIP-associating protein 1 [Galendromus occidentalis]
MEGGALEPWITQMGKQDIRLKLKIGEDLLNWVDNESHSLQGEDVGALIDGLVSWLGSSNSKIQQNGLEILSRIVVRLREDFRPYISSVLPACTDRMGDAKELIRDTNADLLNKMMEVTSPQYILDRLTSAYTHKNFRVREEILLLMQDTVIRYTASCLTISKFIPSICKLMDDPNAQVRDTAMTTLVVIYRYVGDKLRHDLQRKYAIHPNKLQALIERFDKAIENGEMLVSPTQETPGGDEPDRVAPKTKPLVSAKKPALSALASKSSATAKPKTQSAGPAGSVDEESFIEAFSDVPRINVFSARELEQHLSNIRSTISNADVEWEKRLNALRMIRSLVIAGAKDYDEFLPALKTLESSLQSCVKDLRSQIVREACITISYLCVQLSTKMDRLCEQLLPSLILLMGATVKVMSTSGVVCIHFILKNVHSQRLVPVVIQNLSSKNRDLRRHCFEFLYEMLILWPTFTLERHIAILQQAIRAGLSDADQEARSHCRKAFWAFAEHFKAQADSLLFSLDSNKQKMLHGEMGGGYGGMSNSSSSSSLNNLSRGRTAHGNSMESLRNAAGSRTQYPTQTSRLPQPVFSAASAQQRRANSAIDMAAAKSSRLKALVKTPSSGYGYGMTAAGSGLSLPRSAAKARTESVCSAVTSPERTPQSRGRQVSQSQPNSRSASPSSRWSYATYGYGSAESRRTPSRSRIPMATSRDPSPSRSIGSQSSSSALSETQRRRRSSLSRYSGRREPVTIIPSTPTAAEKLLRNSREAEERMAEALGSTTIRSPLSSFGRQHSFGYSREDSDASSVASDRSFRHDDVPEILANLASVHWSDRKDGLAGLLCLLRNQSHALSDPDLQKVTQTLTKMFMDPHTKVFSLFLDTLNELITVHSSDLHRIGFLSILLTKLFIKSGQDLLGSVMTKIGRTMDLIRETFPRQDQFTVITRFLNDPAHSSSSAKVKLQVLNYLEALTGMMDSSDLPANDPNMRDTLLKITNWAGDLRHPDLQQKSRQVIVSLYKVKTPYFSTVINQMAPDFQRTALDVIQSQLKSSFAKPFAGSNPESASQASLGSPDSRTSSSITGLRSEEAPNLTSSPQRSFEDENTENLRANPTSKPTFGNSKLRPLEDHSGNLRKKTTESETTVGYGKGSASERLNHCVQLLASPMNSSEQKRSALAELHILLKEPSLWETEVHFRSVFRVLISNLEEESGIKFHVLKSLTELIRKQPQHTRCVAEQALERILQVAKDKDKDVTRMADSSVSALVCTVLPKDMAKAAAACVMTAMTSRDEPSVLCTAIRVVQKFVDHHTDEVVREQLSVLGPILIRTYDHAESSVRKASVFALVSMHMKIGKDAMHPYTSHLPGCKLRLLNLYIERASQQSHNNGRGESSPSPSTCSNASNL